MNCHSLIIEDWYDFYPLLDEIKIINIDWS
jgi:hypothetical protein